MVLQLKAWISVVLIMGLGSIAARAETIRVTIEKMVFTPAVITAKVGDRIEWINKDIVDHTATVKGRWDVVISSGKAVTLQLERAESVDFYCRFHPNMKGRVTVTP
ncbi:cupredoxin domain-containing protein [Phyllobacterium myrsinacearum]|uniref:Amicyanin n=1 Tax=Phyllobacterium myrsinacearum TaxID=28101 RepID=A0A2S9JNY1_9HYPH|nr:cupredoxin domain-containing protein [Phyllobacterium myrsinacearum]PRD54940.1 amicyanin [Phyllobacterium myrsinacearum]PWV90524.1 plastocyanin [Phyllobacterium myrsinacearum]RZV05283.1 plastocyanin [Phyllobacterium myrsinacearum]